MIDQTFYDGFTLTKAYRALGNGKEQTAEAVEFVSRLLSAGLLIRERTPDSAVPNEPGPAGPYPMSASLPQSSDPVTSDEADTPLKKLSDIESDPAVTPFLPPRDYEDQVSYDRGWRNGREAAFHIAESDAQKRGWNAALDELIEKRLSLEVLRTDINVGTPARQPVREILLGMKKL